MINLIQIIGVQRFTKLILLLVINGILAAGIYFYIMPEMDATTKEFKAVKNEVIRLHNDIDTIETRLVELKENEKQYKRLLKRKFISNQDRLDVRDIIDDMRQRSGVINLNYNIQPIKYIEHDHSYALGYDLIKSDVSVDATSLLDLEVLALQSMLNDEFPGQTVLEEVTYHRTSEINKDNLVKVGSGQAIDFMRSRLNFSWYSLSPKSNESDLEGHL